MACEGNRFRPHKAPGFRRPSSLATGGPLAFQGLSRGDGLLNGRLTTRRGEHGRDRPCRPGCAVKSTARMRCLRIFLDAIRIQRTLLDMDFEWDDAKEARCREERGFGFADALGIFLGRTLEWQDTRKN
jgi:hypothetical protein